MSDSNAFQLLATSILLLSEATHPLILVTILLYQQLQSYQVVLNETIAVVPELYYFCVLRKNYYSEILQLWTLYLEQGMSTQPNITEAYNVTMNIIFDFWGKVTPAILNLLQQSKMVCSLKGFVVILNLIFCSAE